MFLLANLQAICKRFAFFLFCAISRVIFCLSPRTLLVSPYMRKYEIPQNFTLSPLSHGIFFANINKEKRRKSCFMA